MEVEAKQAPTAVYREADPVVANREPSTEWVVDPVLYPWEPAPLM